MNSRQLAAWLIWAGSLTASVPANAATLLEIYRLALDNDATLQSARALRDANQEKIPQARSGLLPSMGGQAQVLRQRSETDIAGPNGVQTGLTSTPKSISFNLTQPLYRPAAWRNYEQSRLLVAQADLQYALARQDLVLRVGQAYFDILAVQDTIDTLASQKIAIDQQLEAAKRNFKIGTATITDQQEAQSRHDLVVAQQIAAHNELLAKRAALENIIGQPAPPLARLSGATPLPGPEPATAEPWIVAAEANNYRVQINELTRAINDRESAKTRASHLPTLDLTSQLGRSQQSTFYGGGATIADVRTANIGIALALPIFNGGAVTSRVREADGLVRKAEQDLTAARRQASLQARQSFVGVQSGLAQIGALEAAERSSQLALNANKLGYEVGVRINIDVLNAQQQLASARRDLARAKYDTLLNTLKLKAAAGSLSEADLQAISGLLEAAATVPGSVVPHPDSGAGS
ncbi:MAG: TolC family outer membrane protein [Burkholderiaceae bacterium]